mgnify:CR=1 FL=1
MINNIGIIFSGLLFVVAIVSGIGPQNLNVISHAIKKNHSYWVATTCFLSDIILIVAGSIGLDIAYSKHVILFINIIGAIFISIYLIQKIWDLVFKKHVLKIENQVLTVKQSVIRALILTWLNPLVFIDTIIVIGGTASHYDGVELLCFIIGAVLGDALWLFSITLIAASFSHKLNNRLVWLFLDGLTILILIFILYKTMGYIVG